MKYAILSALIAAAFPTPAFAATCAIDSTKSKKQVNKLKMTVRNQSSDAMWVSFFVAGDGEGVGLGETYPSHTRTFEIEKAATDGRDATVVSGPHGFEISRYNHGNATSDDDVLDLRFEVINSYSASSDSGASRNTALETTDYSTGRSFTAYDIRCTAKFNDKGKNSWEYKITIKDK